MKDPHKPSAAVSVVIFAVTTGVMAWLRLVVYRHQTLSLGSALPLALCLWHRDRRLLVAMAVAQTAISFVKSYFLLEAGETMAASLTQGTMQLLNILVVGGSVWGALGFADRLVERNRELLRVNAELAAREEEIRAQNEEIQAQSEELQKQNEELQQQGEEVARQTEELQAVNTQLGHRERLMQSLLDALPAAGEDRGYLENVCRCLLDLFGGRAAAAAVLEREGEDLVVRAYVGPARPRDRWNYAGSFASIVLHQNRTAFVEDLRTRPDLRVPQEAGPEPRSILATPLRGGVRGVVKIYAAEPRAWTEEEFRIIEWAANQGSLVLEARRLRADLEQRVAARTGELQALVEELQHFSYTITHDMRAPLRSMQGFAELLAEQSGNALDAESRGYLERIVASAGRMDRLITDALSYAKALREHMSLETVDAAALLQGMVDSYPTFRAPHAEIRIEGAIPPVRANVAGLTQCFSNLLGNAVKFARSGLTPEVRVRAEPRGSRVRLWFEDNGIGIPKEMIDRLFQMFQRGNKAYDGTGIGLALVRKVVEHMGGAVGVESEDGRGSRFWIELQAADGAATS